MNTQQTAARIFNWCLPILSKASSLLLLLTCILSATLLSGCSDSEENKITTPPLEKKEPDFVYFSDYSQLETIPIWKLRFKPEAPLSDKDYWSEPRIMFVRTIERKENQRRGHPGILSQKLDGTDVRMIIPPEDLVAPENAVMRHPPARSPNNRYIVVSLSSSKEGFYLYKVLFDLQENTREVIAHGGGPPNFIWTEDSENIIFYLDFKMKNYHIPTKTLTDRPMINSSGGTLYLRGNTFIAARKDRLEFSSFEGKLLKTIKLQPLEGNIQIYHNLSQDGNYFYYMGETGRIFDIEQEKVVFSYPDIRYSPTNMIFNLNNNLIFFHKKKVKYVEHNFKTDSYQILAPTSMGEMASIINYPPIYPKAE